MPTSPLWRVIASLESLLARGTISLEKYQAELAALCAELAEFTLRICSSNLRLLVSLIR